MSNGGTSPPSTDRRSAIQPPVLRTAENEDDRRPTWTELFFDLVFVAAVGRTNQILAGDPSGSGVTWFVFVFVALTWTWTNFVMYTERFDTDDAPHRLTKAAAMVAVAALAFAAPGVRGHDAVEFALAYVAVRAALIGLYARAWRHVVEARSAIAVYLVGFSLGAALWAASVLVHGHGRTALWVVALVVEIVTPVIGWSRLGESAASAEHLEERAGQFTLIVLGEAVIRSVDGLDTVHWSAEVWLTALAVSVVIVCVWWLTFDFVAKVPAGLRALAVLGGHILIYTAIAALGVGFELALHHADDGALLHEGRWILCGAAVLYLAGSTCNVMVSGKELRALAAHPVMIAVVLGTAVFGTSFGAPTLVAVVAAVLIADILYKVRVLGWGGSAGPDQDSGS